MLAALLRARDGNTRLDPRSRKLRLAVARGMPIQILTAYSPRVMRLAAESPTITETRRDIQRNLGDVHVLGQGANSQPHW
jgi:hypothetical protein